MVLCLNLQGYEPESSVIKEAQRLSKEVRPSSRVVIINRPLVKILSIHNVAFRLSTGPSLF